MTKEQASRIRFLAAKYAANCMFSENINETESERAASRARAASAWQFFVELVDSLTDK